MAGENTESGQDKPQHVSAGELEGEYNLSSNVDAEDGEGDESRRTPTAQELEDAAEHQASLDHLQDDNLARHDERRQAELEAEEEEEEDEGEEPEEEEEELEEEPVAEEEEEEGEEEEAESEDEEDESEDEEESEEEESVAEADAEAWEAWLGEEDISENEAQALLNALIRRHGGELQVGYQADGETRHDTLKDLASKAAGYVGTGKVHEQLHEAKSKLAEAQEVQGEAEATKEAYEARIEAFSEVVDDPDSHADWVLQNADPEWLQTFQERLADGVRLLEEDPHSFRLDRRISGIERALQQLLDGGQPGRNGADAAADEQPSDQEPTPPSSVPADFGFQAGRGYPQQFSNHVWVALQNMLDGAEVQAEDALKAWQDEGRKRPVFEVARGLLLQGKADAKKVDLAKSPPNRKKPQRGSGSKGTRKPSSESPEEREARKHDEVPWEKIPDLIESDLQSL